MSEVQDMRRIGLIVTGAVQGVGFRPFVYRIALDNHLTGWVRNTGAGVELEVQGNPGSIEHFLNLLRHAPPRNAILNSIEQEELPPEDSDRFEIRHSEAGAKHAYILPDLGSCRDCVNDIFDEKNRRDGYPFTNCTNCGPRFSIVRELPYDRPNTSMREFELCPVCQSEYDDPADRRFHAQPNACSVCGPQLALWGPGGREIAVKDEALATAGQALLACQIVAVKGLGGFHLMVRADDEDSVKRLRKRKRRAEKPFALLASGMPQVHRFCNATNEEVDLLMTQQAPIVLLERSDDPTIYIAEAVAPGNPRLGVMLPYTPLHHLLMAEVGVPLVATSANLSDEPICIDEHKAVTRLNSIADLFLVHNRPILRPVDDSVARVISGRPQLLRRSRGYAPLPVSVPGDGPVQVAVGAHLKNTIAYAHGPQAYISQHIGDLETELAMDAFRDAITQLVSIYDDEPVEIVADEHPDYLSSMYAHKQGVPVTTVQHHVAHVHAVMAEHQLAAPVLGFAWDGTGLGPDGTVWGGEVIEVGEDGWTRAAHLRTFHLPGGDAASKDPRRSALGLLYAWQGDDTPALLDKYQSHMITGHDREVMLRMLDSGVNSPETSSMGRLFDAMSALTRVRARNSFEGQAAMEFEWAADLDEPGAYEFTLLPQNDGPTLIDWANVLDQVFVDLAAETAVGVISTRFHRGLADVIVRLAAQSPVEQIVLSGGCFQNKLLHELAVEGLQQAGKRVYWAELVPPNDGGIALGQIHYARTTGRR